MVRHDSKDIFDERNANEEYRRTEKHGQENCLKRELAKKNGNWKNCLTPNGIPTTHILGPNPSIHWRNYPKNPQNDCTPAVMIDADEFVVNGGNHKNLLDTIWLYEKKCGRNCQPRVYWILGKKSAMSTLRVITSTGRKGVALSGYIRGVNTHRLEPVTVIAIRDEKPQEHRYV